MKESYNKSIIEINSEQMQQVFSGKMYQNKDLLVFYFNNWCGFCKLVNYNLISLMQKYFKNVDSFKILK